MDFSRAFVTTDAEAQAEEPGQCVVYAPALQGFALALAPDMIQMPIGNLNAVTARYISSLPLRSGRSAYCGVFVLDPFTQWSDFLTSIRSAGFKGICNYPALPIFGLEERDALAASGFSFQREMEELVRFSKSGLEIAAICSSHSEATQAETIFKDLTAAYCLADDIVLSNSTA